MVDTWLLLRDIGVGGTEPRKEGLGGTSPVIK
jgi:hypothetical protein